MALLLWSSLQKSLYWVELYEQATGGKTNNNKDKFQGIRMYVRMASQRLKKPGYETPLGHEEI